MEWAMVDNSQRSAGDIDAREDLLDRVWGPARFQKTAERLREGRSPGGRAFPRRRARWQHRRHGPALARLRRAGPAGVVARPARCRRGGASPRHRRRVDAARRSRRRGGAGIAPCCWSATPPYYGRFGFSAEKTGALWLPGPYERHRLLGCELVPARSTARAAS